MTDSAATITLVLKAKDLASKEIGGLGKSMQGLGGAAKLALVGGVGLLAAGLVTAVGAAAEEQKGIAKLDQALKNSIPGWDGNRDAIEAVIAKREDLAFSDDDLRGSMAQLVVGTHDVAKAQELQTLAMDLARAKGVDLATATTAVLKATQGSTKELKAMGIEIDDSATASENLATIQKATAGQAEAYAGTMSGKWETFNNKLGDVVEDIGSMLLPIVESLMDFMIETGIPALQSFAKAVGPIVKNVIDLAVAIAKFLFPIFERLVKFVSIMVGIWAAGWKAMFGVAKGAANLLIGIVNGIIKAINSIQVHIGRIGLDTPAGFIGVGPFDWNGLQLAPLKYLAEGGIVRRPTLAMIGEAGPEAVVPLKGGAGQFVPAGPIQVIMDGRVVAELIDARLWKKARTAGSSLGVS